MRWLVACAVLGVLGWPAAGRAEGKLDRARDEIRGGGDDGDRHEERSEPRPARSCSDDDSDNLVSALLDTLFDAIASESLSQGPAYGYARYPYAPGTHGYLVERTPELALGSASGRSDVGQGLSIARPHAWAAQLSVEGGYLDGIARTGPAVRVLMPVPLELDVGTDMLLEPGAPDGADQAMLGRSHLSYRIGEDERLMLRFGLGVRWFADEAGVDLGPELMIGADAFVARPFVLSLGVGVGVLGQAVVPSARIQLGVMLDRVELFAAYDHLQIGDVFLGAPMLGTRLWL